MSTTPYVGYNYLGSSPAPPILLTINYEPTTCPPDCINSYELNRIIWLLPSYTIYTIDNSPNSFIFLYYELLQWGDPYAVLMAYLFIIINLFYWYLLSCLIVWIYDKVRKK